MQKAHFLTLERDNGEIFMNNYKDQIEQMGEKAKHAAKFLRTCSTRSKNTLLLEIANQLKASKKDIMSANGIDVADARSSGLKEALVERLTLNDQRFDEMIDGLEQVIALKDPIGDVDASWLNEAGLTIGSKRVPLGVIAMIYESRPNVTIDASALCLKTGNAVILKGGSDALTTNKALQRALSAALQSAQFPEGCVQLVETTDREFTKQLLHARNHIDCVIPRGGASLIQFVAEHSKIPMIETGIGNCHIYVDASYAPERALDIIKNAKIQRPGACNAVETVLLHTDHVNQTGALEQLVTELGEAGVALALCETCFEKLADFKGDTSHCTLATTVDWETEYLDFKLAVKSVNSMDEAIDHIEKYSSKHSEAILTNDYTNAQDFLNQVDASAVYVNASTRFTDGSQFGFGAEIGISTQKLHARGPMGLKALTTIKYVVCGNGQVRL